MCVRCEKEYTLGGYVVIPGREDIPLYCLNCGLEAVAEFHKTKQIKNVLIVKPKIQED